ncbi:hypothetical protein [Stutzerimonas stutzeri]|uniref:Uncharacterized protein n=1 Tax=Stutzerimonas stutzeri TaxID=316 RepID=A0A0D7DYJ2_STUST|nr:hypothetical protein [Stutzerimonas stutzeri]KIZ33634.1 hypothetical protein LO50_19940 [Stutzerimonas stutzeri]MBA1265459.1 hypothetical protein [Stutzerimonas stutzeri]
MNEVSTNERSKQLSEMRKYLWEINDSTTNGPREEAIRSKASIVVGGIYILVLFLVITLNVEQWGLPSWVNGIKLLILFCYILAGIYLSNFTAPIENWCVKTCNSKGWFQGPTWGDLLRNAFNRYQPLNREDHEALRADSNNGRLSAGRIREWLDQEQAAVIAAQVNDARNASSEVQLFDSKA